MRLPWLFVTFSLFGSQAARGSPLPSKSSTALNLSSNISAQDLGGITLKSTGLSSEDSPPVYNSTNTFNTSGPVTVVNTIELIPQPVPSDLIPQANIFLHHANHLVPEIGDPPPEPPQTITPSLLPSAGPRSSFISAVSSSLQVTPPQASSTTSVSKSSQVTAPQSIFTPSVSSSLQVTAPQVLSATSVSDSLDVKSLQPLSTTSISSILRATASQSTNQLVKAPKLPPIVVGGITYAPVYTHSGPSRVPPGQGNPQVSQTSSGVEKAYGSNPDDQGRDDLESKQAKASLPPVVVGGLTYIHVDETLGSESQTTASVDVAGSTTATANPVIHFFTGVGTMSSSPQAGPPIAEPPPSASPDISVTRTVQSSNTMSLSLSPTSLLIDVSSFTFQAPPPTTATPITNNNASLNSSPPLVKTGLSLAPASPPIITLANQTFTAYPLGLAIAGTEVFQGSSAVTVSGTVISLGSSDVVVGASTIAFASVPGLGAALSSGLGADASTSTSETASGTEPHATSTGPTQAHGSSSSSRLDRGGRVGIVTMMVVFIIVVL